MSILAEMFFCPTLKLLLPRCQAWDALSPHHDRNNALLVSYQAGSQFQIPDTCPESIPLSFPTCFYYIPTLWNRSTSTHPPHLASFSSFKNIIFKSLLILPFNLAPHIICQSYASSVSTNLPINVHSFTGYAMRALCSFQSVFMFIIKVKQE